MNEFNMLTAIVSAAICMRIMMYRRGGAKYRPWVSIIAYLMAMSTGCYSLAILLHEMTGQPLQASPFALVVLCILAAMIFRAKGNMSQVLRTHWED